MFITKKNVVFPDTIKIDDFEIEVVKEFKLLGVTIDNKFSFNSFFNSLKSKVYKRLFSISKIFYLPYNVKIQFFKTFLLPYFDYCISLYLYFPKTVLLKMEKLFNHCLFILLDIDLKYLNVSDQLVTLSKFHLMPFFYRYLFRFSIFSYKILNSNFLTNIKNKLKLYQKKHYFLREKNIIFESPTVKTVCGEKRLSVFLPKFVNIVLKNYFYLNYNDLRSSLLTNLNIYFENFQNLLNN